MLSCNLVSCFVWNYFSPKKWGTSGPEVIYGVYILRIERSWMVYGKYDQRRYNKGTKRRARIQQLVCGLEEGRKIHGR